MPNSVTVNSFSIPDVNYKGSTAKLRRYYTENWTDQNGVLHLSGRPGSLTDAFDEIDCTLASHTLTVPQFSATVTLFNGANPYAREIWQLWDQSNKARNIITSDGGWFIPDNPNLTNRQILEIINRGQYLDWPLNLYLRETDVLALLEAQAQRLGVTGVAVMSGGLATVERESMTFFGGAHATALAPMSGNFNIEIIAGVGFNIVSTDGGDEGRVTWTAYDDLS